MYDVEHDRMKKAVIDGMAHNKWNASMIYGHRFSSAYRFGASLSTRGSSKRYYENNGNGKHFQIWRINTTHDFGKANAETSYKVELGVDNIFNFKDTTMRPYHLGNNNGGTSIYVSFAINFNKGKKINNHNYKQKTKQNEED